MSRRRLLPGLSLLAALLVVLVACGTRAPESEFRALVGGGTGSPGVSGPQAGGPAPEGGTVGDGGAVGVPTAGAGPVTGGGPTGGGPVTGGGPTGGGPVSNGGATDVGVTGSEILVGNITSIGGPLPGQFDVWLRGVQTWFAVVNARGGIHGRRLRLLVCDDASDPLKDRACAQDLIVNKKVFALVGTNTFNFTDTAAWVNEQKVPVVGSAPIGNEFDQYPWLYSAYGSRAPRDGKLWQPCCLSLTQYLYFRDVVGVRKAAVFWHNIAISKEAGENTAAALEESGVDVVYTAETQVAEPDYTPHVIKMKERGVEGIWNTQEVNSNIRLMQAMQRQGFRPKAFVSTISTWDQRIKDQVRGSIKDIIYVTGFSVPYTYTQSPAIAEWLRDFRRYFPKAPIHQWSVDGYAGAKIFTDALQAIGPRVTRLGLKAYLDTVHRYDAGGLMRPYEASGWITFRSNVFHHPHRDNYCNSIAKFTNDDFYKVPGPVFYCRNHVYAKNPIATEK